MLYSLFLIYIQKQNHNLYIEDLVEKILPSVKGAKDIDEAIHNNIDNVAKEIKDDDMIKDLVKENKV